MSGLGQKGQNKLGTHPVDELFGKDKSSMSLNKDVDSNLCSKKTIRKGFICPIELHEQLRTYSFKNNMTETSILIASLQEYFANHPSKQD